MYTVLTELGRIGQEGWEIGTWSFKSKKQVAKPDWTLFQSKEGVMLCTCNISAELGWVL